MMPFKSLNNCTFSVPYHGIVFSTNTQLAKRMIIGGCQLQGGHRVNIIDHWSIFDHFAQMVDILDFVPDRATKFYICCEYYKGFPSQ